MGILVLHRNQVTISVYFRPLSRISLNEYSAELVSYLLCRNGVCKTGKDTGICKLEPGFAGILVIVIPLLTSFEQVFNSVT